MLLSLPFLQCFFGQLTVYIPDRAPDSWKVRTNPGHTKFHAAFRALDMRIAWFRLQPSHTAWVVAAELTIGSCLAETFGCRRFFFVNGHLSFLSIIMEIKKFIIMNK
jgi:hypothetical protein